MYTKVNPFLQIIEAFKGVYSPESLYNLRKQSTGSKILYAIIVSILIAIIICGWGVFTINTDEELENVQAEFVVLEKQLELLEAINNLNGVKAIELIAME